MPPRVSPASSSTTIKPGYLPRVSPLAASPASVSTIKPGGSVSHNPVPLPNLPSKPATLLSPREQFAKFYGFTLPPPPPYPEDSVPVKPNLFAKNSASINFFSSPSVSGGGGGPTCNNCHQNLLPLDSDQLIAQFNAQFVRTPTRMQSASSRKAAPFQVAGGSIPMHPNSVHSDQQAFKWMTLRHRTFTSRLQYILLNAHL
jgi:hypothetical protein